MQFQMKTYKTERQVIKLEYIVIEQDTRKQKDPAAIDKETEKDDFRQFLDDLRMEQQEQG